MGASQGPSHAHAYSEMNPATQSLQEQPHASSARPNEEISELSSMVKNLLTEQAELKDKLAA